MSAPARPAAAPRRLIPAAAAICGTSALLWVVLGVVFIVGSWSTTTDLQAKTLAAMPAANGGTSAIPTAQIPVLWWHLHGSLDTGLLLIVLSFGALAAAAHCLYVLSAAVPARDFSWPRLGWFLPEPILGAILALLLYVLVRAALLSSTSVNSINLFGAAGIAAAGGISAQATFKKLNSVLSAFGSGSSTAAAAGPTITAATPATLGSATAMLAISGTGLAKASFELAGAAITPASVSDTTAVFALDPATVLAQKPSTVTMTARVGARSVSLDLPVDPPASS
jgi:hypothetical protein